MSRFFGSPPPAAPSAFKPLGGPAVVVSAPVPMDLCEQAVQVDDKKYDLSANSVSTGSSVLLRGKVQRSASASLPPEIVTAPTVRHPIRFYTSSAVSDEAITVTDCLGAIMVVGRVSNTSFTPIASSFRVRKVTIWNAPNLGSSEVAWLASDIARVKDETKNTATPSGSVASVKNVFTPPKGSIAFDWILSTLTGSTQLFRLSVPQGSIIDIDFEYTLSTGHITMSAINSVSGSVTVGAFYRLYLDRASGNGYIRPIAFASNT